MSGVSLAAQTTVRTTPSGPITQALLSVSPNAIGNIGAGFAGLSYEKATLCEPLFTASNADLIGPFKLLGPSVLRIGGSSVDQCVWVPDGPGRTSGQIAPSDVASLAAFVQEAGWQCIYGVNLGGAATGATTPELAAAEVAYAAQLILNKLDEGTPTTSRRSHFIPGLKAKPPCQGGASAGPTTSHPTAWPSAN